MNDLLNELSKSAKVWWEQEEAPIHWMDIVCGIGLFSIGVIAGLLL